MGVGFGCDITYKDKDKIVYRFSTKANQAKNQNSSNSRIQIPQPIGTGTTVNGSTVTNGAGTFQTLDQMRRASAKYQTTSTPGQRTKSRENGASKSRQGRESALKDTHITSTLHQTINDSGQSPMKSPKLQGNTHFVGERSQKEGISSIIPDRDQKHMMHKSWHQSKRPLTSKIRTQHVFSRRVETVSGNQSEVRPQSSGADKGHIRHPMKTKYTKNNNPGQRLQLNNFKNYKSSIVTESLEILKNQQIISNNPYSVISGHDRSSVIKYRFDIHAQKLGQHLSGARTNQTDLSNYNNTKRDNYTTNQNRNILKTRSTGGVPTHPNTIKTKQITSRNAINFTQGGVGPAQNRDGGQGTAKIGKATTVRDLQIMAAIGMMGGFGAVVNKKQIMGTAAVDKATLASNTNRNPFQLALGVQGRQAGQKTVNQQVKGTKLKIINGMSPVGNQLMDKSRGSLRIDNIATIKREGYDDQDGAEIGNNDYSRDFEEQTEVTGPAGGDASAAIRFRDELETNDNGTKLQRMDYQNQRGMQSRRRLISKQGIISGNQGRSSQNQLAATSEQELNPQFRVEFRKSNGRGGAQFEGEVWSNDRNKGRICASSSGFNGYDSALQAHSSHIANNNNLAAASVAASLPENPRFISSDGIPNHRGRVASQQSERHRGGYDCNEGNSNQDALQIRARRDRGGDDVKQVDMEEQPTELIEFRERDHNDEMDNVKSTSIRQVYSEHYVGRQSLARQTNESKSSLRRQIDLTKNLRKNKQPNVKGALDDPEEIELLNDDDFVRAPLNLAMDLYQNNDHQIEDIYMIKDTQIPTRMSQSKLSSREWQNHAKQQSGNKAPKSRSNNLKQLNKLYEINILTNAGDLQSQERVMSSKIYSPKKEHTIVNNQGLRSPQNSQFHSQPNNLANTSSQSKKPNVVVSKSIEKAKIKQDLNDNCIIDSPTFNNYQQEKDNCKDNDFKLAMKQQDHFIPLVQGESFLSKPHIQKDDGSSPIPKTAEWSPLKAGGITTLEKTAKDISRDRQDYDQNITTIGLPGQTNAASVTITKHTDVTATQINTIGFHRGSVGQSSRQLQLQIENYEHQMDIGAQNIKELETYYATKIGQESCQTLEKARIVNNIVLFSKSPNQLAETTEENQNLMDVSDFERKQVDDIQTDTRMVAIDRKQKMASTQKQPLTMLLSQTRHKSKQRNRRILDILKPQSTQISQKNRNQPKSVSSNNHRSNQKPQKINIPISNNHTKAQIQFGSTPVTSLPSGSQSVATRLAHLGAVGHKNPLPGWRHSEAGRLMASFRMCNKRRQKDMERIFSQGKISSDRFEGVVRDKKKNQFSKIQGLNKQNQGVVDTGLLSGKNRDIEDVKKEVINQRLYLMQNDPKNKDTLSQNDVNYTQFDITRLNQDGFCSFYDLPYQMVVQNGAVDLTNNILGTEQNNALTNLNDSDPQLGHTVNQTYLQQEDTQVLSKDQLQDEHGMTGGDLLTPKSDVRLVTQELDTQSKPELQAYHIQSVVFPVTGGVSYQNHGQKLGNKSSVTPNTAKMEQQQLIYDPPSTQYIENSAKNGTIGAIGTQGVYGEVINRQATSFNLSENQQFAAGVMVGEGSLPGSNPISTSLPRSLKGETVLRDTQQLQSTLSKNLKASTLVLPDSKPGMNIEGECGEGEIAIGQEYRDQVQFLGLNSVPGRMEMSTQLVGFLGSNIVSGSENAITGRQNQYSGVNQEIQMPNSGLISSTSNSRLAHVGQTNQQTLMHQSAKQSHNKLVSQQQSHSLDNDQRPDQRDSNVTNEQKQEIEQMILHHIMQSITSQENIQVILNSKNQNQLIFAKDANFMNQAVFNKFAKTWAQREGVRTNADDVLKECRDKIHRLYLEVASYFGMQAPGSQSDDQINSNQFPASAQTYSPNQTQFLLNQNAFNKPSGSQINYQFRDLLSSNSREQISADNVGVRSDGLGARGSKNVHFVGPNGSNVQNPHQRASSQQSGGTAVFPSKMQTYHHQLQAQQSKPEFNVQIKYKNAENEVNQFKDLIMSQIGRRNSFRIETVKPLSPTGAPKDINLAQSQQFPKKLRTPVYPDSMPKGNQRRLHQSQGGGAAQSKFKKTQNRLSVAAISSQATHVRGPSERREDF